MKMEIKTDLVALCAANSMYKKQIEREKNEMQKREKKAIAYSNRVRKARERKELYCHLVAITILIIIVTLVAVFYEPATPMQAVASESVSGIHYVYVPVE
jgi:predicted membrane channel-forming protein YqfA (hemolysin III family)